MIDRPIKAQFQEFPLTGAVPSETAAVIPTVRAGKWFRGGGHAYYFLNLKTLKGLCVSFPHWSVILPGLRRFARATSPSSRFPSLLGLLGKKYHYGFNLLEQIMLMTVPHTVTDIGEERFVISLWSYCGAVLVDLRNRSVTYKILSPTDDNSILGARLWYEAHNDSLLYMTYSLNDSLKRAADPSAAVISRICEYEIKTGERRQIWEGYFADYMHDILLSDDRQHLVACEMGRFQDRSRNLIPSRVLLLDLKERHQWIISEVANAAHAQFDPDDPQLLYFSNHNFRFEHTKTLELLRKRTYSLKFLGNASVHKYRLTEDGAHQVGVFAQPDLFRLTNFHVFYHRRRKILAAMGAPNFIFIADAESMKLISKVEVLNPSGTTYVGTFCPSSDGEKLYVQTTRAFHIVDLASGKSEFVHTFAAEHTCSNHMMITKSTAW